MKQDTLKNFSKTALAIAVTYAIVNFSYAKAESLVLKADELPNTQSYDSNDDATAELNPDVEATVKDENSTEENTQTKEADESSAISVETTNVLPPVIDRSEIVTKFANNTLEIMQSKASLQYLENLNLASSSTFPMRLLNKMRANPWQASPNFPIPAKDLIHYYGVPGYKVPKQFDVNKEPVVVRADTVDGLLGEEKDSNILTYRGNVEITQVDRKINSEVAIYDQKASTLTTKGAAVLQSPDYTVHTEDDVETNLETKVVKLTNSRFQLNGSRMRGSAEEHRIDNANNIQNFKWSTITSCPVDNNSWSLKSSSLEIDKSKSFGDSWNDVFYAGPVPVFYIPYMNFPITSERRSGLLVPEVSWTEDGLSYTQPIYLNLATNYDATFTPEHDAEHGAIYNLQFRYMPFRTHQGVVELTYLPNDKTWDNDSDDKKRWFMHIEHQSAFLDGDLTAHINFSKVRNNDYSYISDVSSKNATVDDNSLLQSLKVNYVQDKYSSSIELRKYQNLFNPSVYRYKPFALLPQIKLEGSETYGPFILGFDSEITNFNLEKLADTRTINATRSHFEPYIKYHAFDSFGTTLDFQLRGFYTHYEQGDTMKAASSYRTSYLGNSELDNSVNRALFLFETKAKTTFERKVIDMNHTQTLEPEINYQFIPYKDQSRIALFDTTSRYDDYNSLFSFRKFSGLDRIQNVNALTAGFTTRLLDVHDREQMKFSIAQAYNFTDQKVTRLSTDTYSTNPKTPVQAVLDIQPIDELKFHSAIQYDPRSKEINNLNSYLRYQGKSGFMLGTSFRYLRDGDYMVKTQQLTDLKQVGVEMRIPLSSNWEFIGANYRDINQKYNIDTKLALKYEESCYALTFVYEKYVKMDWTNREHYDEKIVGMLVELKDLLQVRVKGIDNAKSTTTHYIPSISPDNLNR